MKKKITLPKFYGNWRNDPEKSWYMRVTIRKINCVLCETETTEQGYYHDNGNHVCKPCCKTLSAVYHSAIQAADGHNHN